MSAERAHPLRGTLPGLGEPDAWPPHGRPGLGEGLRGGFEVFRKSSGR